MVITYHVGMPFSGGFFGVDVFFVISGFVITNLLLRERESSGNLNLGRFYWRRFKRLMPALAIVVTFTIGISTALLSPLGPQQVAAGTGIAAMFLSANIYISQNTGNYFDASADLNPLLNTWSLSVEEQFYLIFPVILLVFWVGSGTRNLRHRALVAVTLVTVMSFVLTVAGNWLQLGTRLDLIFTPFYSPVTRAWEFGLGALIGILPFRKYGLFARVNVQQFAGAAGLLMIISAWLGAGGSAPSPGLVTLLPVLGTLLVIYSGSTSFAVVPRALSTPTLVAIGNYSYSLYLWHWPMIVFAAVLFPANQFALWVAVLVSIFPAMTSYYFVEQPIRAWKNHDRSMRILLIGLVMLIPVVTGIGCLKFANAFLTPRYESGEFRILKGDLGPDAWRKEFTSRYQVCESATYAELVPDWEGKEMCRQSTTSGPTATVVLGDSHSQDVFIAIADAYPYNNVMSLGFGGTPPSLRGLADMRDAIFNVAEESSIETVVLSAKWGSYGPEAWTDLQDVISLLVRSGKEIYLTEDVPSFSFEPEQCAMRRIPLLPGSRCDETFEGPNNFSFADPRAIEKLAQRIQGVHRLDLPKLFCQDSKCSMRSGDTILFRDSHHLTIEGSNYIGANLSDLSSSFHRRQVEK